MANIFYAVFYTNRYITSLLIRFIIIIVTEYLYHHHKVLYTDIDYHVFSDGALHLSKLESPYERETYRYTPILAAMMIPNVKIWYPIGKFFLSTVDVLVAYLIEKLLDAQTPKKQEKNLKEYIEKRNKEKKKKQYCIGNDDNGYPSMFYLYNPLTVVICTRGSADCLITLMVLGSLVLLEKKHYAFSSIVYGFAVHFKIYPIIYAPALYLYLLTKEYDQQKEEKEDPIKEKLLLIHSSPYKIIIDKTIYPFKLVLFNFYKTHSIIFVFISAFIFISFIGLFYVLLGYKFLFEYLLYHVLRKDHRHNYSIFYYLIYLTYDNNFSNSLSLIAFLPQMILILLATLFLYREINLCLIILTMIFVTFNKVITSQYFIWFFSLLPLIISKNQLFNKQKIKGIILLIIWWFFEIIWNVYSHQLEYNGKNTFMEMWIVDVCFFLVNCLCIKELIVNNE